MDPLESLIKIELKGKFLFVIFRHWWQYLIVVGLIGLALAFLLAGKVESIVFDKTQK